MGDSVKNRHAQSSGAGHRCMSPLNSDRTAKYKEAESTNFAKRYKKIMSGSGEPSGLSSLPEEEGLTYDGHIRYHHGATVLTLPLTLDNVFAIGLILLLALLGCFYIWKLITRKTCSCELCSGQQVLGDLLETGSYGSVYSVTNMKSDQDYVLKKIHAETMADAKDAHSEARKLQALRHPNIVKYHSDFLHTEYGLESRLFVCIVMEFCRAGDLHSRIIDASDGGKPLNQQLIIKWFKQICSAVKYLHTRNILHRDLKSANVFLTSKGQVRVGDLGLARKTKRTAKLTKCGTDVYMAPEMIAGAPYGKKADVWSLGCILFEMMTGVFMSELPGILGARAIQHPEDFIAHLIERIPQDFLPEFTKLLRSMLERNPAQRIAIVGIVEKLNLITKQLGGDAQINTPRGSMGGDAAGEASGGTELIRRI